MTGDQESAAWDLPPVRPTVTVGRAARNPFRILGISATASSAEAHTAASGLRRSIKLGISKTTPWDLPWLGGLSRSEAAVQEAQGRLGNIRLRLEDRLFWFHVDTLPSLVPSPSNLNYCTDQLRATGHPGARHDAALLELLTADIHDPALEQADLWMRAISSWIALAADDDYWNYLLERETIGGYEPAANAADIGELRAATVRLIHENVVTIAKLALASHNDAVVIRALMILRAGVQGEALVGLEEMLLSPLEDAVIASCEEIRAVGHDAIVREEAAAKTNRSICETVTGRFDGEVMPQLARIEHIAGKESVFVLRARGQAALALVGLGGAWTWADDWVKSKEILTRASVLGTGTPSEARIAETLGQVTTNAAIQKDKIRPIGSLPSLYTLNGVGTTLYSLGRRYEGNPAWTYATQFFVIFFIPIVPLKRYLVTKAPGGGWYFHATLPFSRWHKLYLGGVFGVLGLLALIVNFAPGPSASAAASSGSGGYSANDNADTGTDDPNLTKQTIDADRAEIGILEARLGAAKTELTTLAEKFKKVEHDPHGSARRKALLKRGLELQKQYDATYADYKQRIVSTNQLIDKYNQEIHNP